MFGGAAERAGFAVVQLRALLFEVGNALVIGEFAQDAVFFGAVFAQQAVCEVGGERAFGLGAGGGSVFGFLLCGSGGGFGFLPRALCGCMGGGVLFENGELFALVAQGVVVGAGLLPGGLGGGEALFFGGNAGAGVGMLSLSGFLCGGKRGRFFVKRGEGGAVLLLRAAQGVEAGVVGVKQHGLLRAGEARALRCEADKGGFVRGLLVGEAVAFGV